MSRWIITLPPEGAARQVGQDVAAAFAADQKRQWRVFDCGRHDKAFSSMLRNPTDELVVDLLNQSLLVQCMDFGATHLLVPALSPISLFALSVLRKNQVTTIHWFFEDFRRAVYWKDVIGGYQYFCAVQRGPLPDACSAAASRYHFLTTAASPASAMVSPEAVKTTDVVFIGVPSPYRIAMLESLHAGGVSLAIAGAGWEHYQGILKTRIASGSWVDGEKSARLMAQGKIGLNLSYDTPWSDASNAQVSPRIFEYALSRLVILTEDLPLLRDTAPDLRMVTFSPSTDLPGLVKSLLVNYPDHAASLAENVHATDHNHRYSNRLTRLFELVGDA